MTKPTEENKEAKLKFRLCGRMLCWKEEDENTGELQVCGIVVRLWMHGKDCKEECGDQLQRWDVVDIDCKTIVGDTFDGIGEVVDCWNPELRKKPPGQPLSFTGNEPTEFEKKKVVLQQVAIPNRLPFCSRNVSPRALRIFGLRMFFWEGTWSNGAMEFQSGLEEKEHPRPEGPVKEVHMQFCELVLIAGGQVHLGNEEHSLEDALKMGDSERHGPEDHEPHEDGKFMTENQKQVLVVKSKKLKGLHLGVTLGVPIQKRRHF